MARALLLLFPFFCISCGGPSKRTVVIYCSLDEIFARPILRAYEDKTGVDVREVFDSEAVKTVGLANRLIAEKKRPRADVFWNGEFSRTIFLKQKGVLTAYQSPNAGDIPAQFHDETWHWTGYACRARVICYNPHRLASRKISPPRSIFQLADSQWRGRVAICDPMIGTAASGATALYLELGKRKADEYFLALQKNKVKIVPGNSVVADMVVKGIVDVGVTDIDDVYLRKQQGKQIELAMPDQDGIGTLLIPATVALIKNAPHASEGESLIDYLLSREVERALSRSAGHMSVRGDSPLKKVRGMSVSFDAVGREVERVTKHVQELLKL